MQCTPEEANILQANVRLGKELLICVIEEVEA